MKTTFIMISALLIFYISPLFGAVVVRHATPVYHHNTVVKHATPVYHHNTAVTTSTVVRTTHPVARRSAVRARVR